MIDIRDLIAQSFAGTLEPLRKPTNVRRWDDGLGWELNEPGGHGLTRELRAFSRRMSYRQLGEWETRQRDRRLAGKARVQLRRRQARLDLATREAAGRVVSGHISGFGVRVPDAAPQHAVVSA